MIWTLWINLCIALDQSLYCFGSISVLFPFDVTFLDVPLFYFKMFPLIPLCTIPKEDPFISGTDKTLFATVLACMVSFVNP
jgi:hypothetical protein